MTERLERVGVIKKNVGWIISNVDLDRIRKQCDLFEKLIEQRRMKKRKRPEAGLLASVLLEGGEIALDKPGPVTRPIRFFRYKCSDPKCKGVTETPVSPEEARRICCTCRTCKAALLDYGSAVELKDVVAVGVES